MPIYHRLTGPGATLVVLAIGNAYAEEPVLTDPPEDTVRCEGEAPPPGCPPVQTTQAPALPPPEPAPVEVTDVEAPEEEVAWYESAGFGLSIGGGVDDFVGDGFRDTTSVGGSWNVRATWGTRSWLALEGSYIGSAQSIDALGIDDDDEATLIGNGLQAAVRVNILPDMEVQPFLYGGAAWRHYELANSSFNTSDVDDSDDVFEVPVGVGVAGYISGLMADLRAEYRGAWGTDLIPSLEDADDDAIIGEMDRWGITGSIGMAF